MASVKPSTDHGSTADGSATRERIVEAASSMFPVRGFDAVPMSQVAEAAGVTTPAVYWHFKSKTDLYFETIARSYRDFFEQLAQRTRGGTGSERLRSYVLAFIEMQVSDQEASMTFGIGQLGARLPEERQEEFAALQRPYNELLKSILEQGVKSGEFALEDASVTALAIHTMCEYSAVWFRPERRLTGPEVAKLHADLVLRMVAASPAEA